MVEGSRVRLKSNAPLCMQHPELAGAIGIISSILHGPAWSRLSSSQADRKRDTTMHVRFAPPVNFIALNVEASQFEPADRLDPEPHVA